MYTQTNLDNKYFNQSETENHLDQSHFVGRSYIIHMTISCVLPLFYVSTSIA